MISCVGPKLPYFHGAGEMQIKLLTSPRDAMWRPRISAASRVAVRWSGRLVVFDIPDHSDDGHGWQCLAVMVARLLPLT